MKIAIIPARGGSKRIPRKNVRSFHGKPIIAYSIETARRSGLFGKIVVSTDDHLIAAVAKAYGAKIHMRAAALADDLTGTQEVARAALLWWRALKHNGVPVEQPDVACCIYATAPLMRAEHLQAGLEALLPIEGEAVYGLSQDSLATACNKFAFSVGADGKDAGQWYWGRPQDFIDRVPLSGPGVVKVPLPAECVCDINTEDDWQRAERMYQQAHAKDLGAPASCPKDPGNPCRYVMEAPDTPDPLVRAEGTRFTCVKCERSLPT